LLHLGRQGVPACLEERDRQLASTLDKMARRELRRSGGARSGGQSGRRGVRADPKGGQRSWPIGGLSWEISMGSGGGESNPHYQLGKSVAPPTCHLGIPGPAGISIA